MLKVSAQPDSGFRPEEVAELMGRVAHQAAGEGAGDLAVEAFQALPAALRRQVIADPGGISARTVDDYLGRLQLAVALVAAGDLDSARALFQPMARFAPPTEVNPRVPREACAWQLPLRVLDWYLGPHRPADSFDLVEAQLSCRARVPTEVIWPIAAPRYTQPFIELVQSELASRRQGPPEQPTPLLEERRQIQRAQQAHLVRLRRLPVPLVSGAAAGTGAVAPAVDGGGTRGPGVWQELPLPTGTAAYAADGVSEGAIGATPISLPQGFRPLSSAWIGPQLVAVAVSQAVDPTGDGSEGGYWLFISSDGTAWEPAIYTGLVASRPYVIVPHSNLRVLSADGQRVQLEVAIAGRAQTGLVVQADLATLRRDTDGDGLTDLLEERLMLSPSNPDTDGDGLRDGDDPIPNVPFTSPASADAALLESFFEARSAAHPRETPNGRGALGRSSTDAVQYIDAGGLDFRGVKSAQRLIVLQGEAIRAALGRFGTFYPLTFTTVLRSTDGTKVYLRFSERWRGGAVHAELKDGHWTVTSLGEWVS
jgi:hypothetical protein